MSLRRRLVAGMLLLLVVAVIVTDVVTQSHLRSYLYGRLDEQDDVAESQAYSYIESAYLRAEAASDRAAAQDPASWLAQLALPSTGPLDLGVAQLGSAAAAPVTSGISAAQARAEVGQVPRTGRLNPSVLAGRISPDIYVEVLGPGGQVLFRRPSGSAEQPDPAPVLPSALVVSSALPTARYGSSHGPYLPSQPDILLDAKGQSGAYYYGETLRLPGGALVSATPLAPSQQTLASLNRVELLVSVVVVLVLLALVLGTVRLGLRPLEDMTDTARAIAGGDLRRRIRRSDDRGEVGRLGAALNGMLGQIEAAFAERTASEARLRRFVADASHELRTPLTSIRGYAELLRKGALDDEAARQEAAGRIEHEAMRMGVLVDDLLLLARLDQGRPLDRGPVDLAEVTARAVEATGAAHPDRSISLVAPGPVIVDADVGRIRQVVDNLLQNAMVHTPPGTAVRAEVRSGGGVAELVVADEGPGIAAEEIERVFDRFYRGASARGRPGTGLGLSIVAALAAAHGGRAWAEPGPAGGARVVVELPLRRATGDGPPSTQEATTPFDVHPKKRRIADGDDVERDGSPERSSAAAEPSGTPLPSDSMAHHGASVGEAPRR
ncbi:MAG TPA: HAMP domain-containing sensor histidine kinase [Acidimicrobiales bacterium]|nr:HAMP domain-containing sensor histidine kinase [Acidimicrobiales bacterium]